ncbi:MAG: hypothetical protein ACJAUW_001076, partial [Yoonia sp.]
MRIDDSFVYVTGSGRHIFCAVQCRGKPKTDPRRFSLVDVLGAGDKRDVQLADMLYKLRFGPRFVHTVIGDDVGI